MENSDSVRLLEKDEPIRFAWDLTTGMYNLSGEDEDIGGGSPPHGGGGEGGGGSVGDGGDAGGGQPGAGDGEAGDGGGQPLEGGAPVPGGGLHLEVGWFLTFPMSVSNPCSVMIGRVLSKDLGGEEGDGVSVHWYTPKRRKNPCRRSVHGRGSWSPDFVYDSNNKRVADSGIESASAACFTFPCLLASGKLPAAVWVAVEENVEPPSEAEGGEEEEEEEGEEEEEERPPANAGGLGAAGSASLELPSRALKVRKTAAAFKPSRHTTRSHYR